MAQEKKVGRRLDAWTARDRAAFLDQLAASGHVARAALSVGRTASAAQSLKRRDAEFAAAWGAAMAAACDALQAKLIEHAMGDAGPAGGSAPASFHRCW